MSERILSTDEQLNLAVDTNEALLKRLSESYKTGLPHSITLECQRRQILAELDVTTAREMSLRQARAIEGLTAAVHTLAACYVRGLGG